MKPSPSSKHDEQDEEIIKRLKDLGSFKSEYPPELLAARRAAFLARVEQLSPVETSEKLSAGDQEVVKRLGNLKSDQLEYPPELLTARRAAFLARVEQLSPVEISEELAAGDEEVVKRLGILKSDPLEYPPELLAARRSLFLHQVAAAGGTSVLDRLRVSIKRRFAHRTTTPAASPAGFRRISLVIASLLAAVLLGSLLLNRTERSLSPAPSQAAAVSTALLPAGTGDVALAICTPEDPSPACASAALTASQDLANQRNGTARPAVSKDGRTGVHSAAYVNDGRGGESWVSESAYSWIKIDLGQVTTINTISLQKGSPGSSSDNDLGQFVIAVALRDVYTDGNSSSDYTEYAQVFNSEETGFDGTVSQAETVQTRFAPIRARFIKITFEQAGAAIEEVGVFMVPPTRNAEQATSRPQDDLPGTTFTPAPTNTPLLVDPVTSTPTGTELPTDTAVLVPTNTLSPSSTPAALPSSTPTLLPTNTRPPSSTPTSLPTRTQPPADTSTPVPTDPLPSVVPPTAIPATRIPPTVQPSPASSGPIVVTGNDQTLIFTCSGSTAEIRGHANTVTLLGSCSSITVTGNGNRVFWQSGSPLITDRGKDNIISQR